MKFYIKFYTSLVFFLFFLLILHWRFTQERIGTNEGIRLPHIERYHQKFQEELDKKRNNGNYSSSGSRERKQLSNDTQITLSFQKHGQVALDKSNIANLSDKLPKEMPSSGDVLAKVKQNRLIGNLRTNNGDIMKSANLSTGHRGECTPHNNIVFLKTHRCGTSTVQNIFYRWGDEKNLSFVLPVGKWPYMGNPSLFEKKYAIPSVDEKYNILANHARFSEEGMAEIMPENSIYVTILREPVTQYESLYAYTPFNLRYGADLYAFLHIPSLYFSLEPDVSHIVGRNSMLFDLGLDARQLDANDTSVNEWIQMLDKKFNLVLIAEYLPESLLLLKDLLCWSTNDVVYLSHNAREAENRTLSEWMRVEIRKWNSADAKLYDHFNRTLWRKIEGYGIDRMRRHVEELRNKTESITKDCVESTMTSGDDRIWYPPEIKIESFRVNPRAENKVLCDRITRPEMTYVQILAEKQHQRNGAIQVKQDDGPMSRNTK